jgi:xanthine dehydrogenase accessory factor
MLAVLESKGSSPGRQGFKMLVAGDHHFLGTIGGGIMEHKFVEMAKSYLDRGISPVSLHKQVHDKQSDHQSGMICSGEQTILFYPLRQRDKPVLESLSQSLLQNQNGSLTLTNDQFFFSEELPEADFFFRKTADDFVYIEKTGFRQVIHIIGGGHCSLALSKIMRDLDFYIHIYDERSNLSTMRQNEFAHQQHLVKSYADLSSLIQGGKQEYLVIMTFGYRTDDEAFRALLGKTFKYFGMLGSRKKIEKMFAEYDKNGNSQDQLRRVFAPVGLDIKSETTAEIAISIAAQIIQEKNKTDKSNVQ